MAYVLRGTLCGTLCADCTEPIANATVRLYRPDLQIRETVAVAARTKDTFTILSAKETEARGKPLAKTETDDDGSYRFDLSDE